MGTGAMAMDANSSPSSLGVGNDIFRVWIPVWPIRAAAQALERAVSSFGLNGLPIDSPTPNTWTI